MKIWSMNRRFFLTALWVATICPRSDYSSALAAVRNDSLDTLEAEELKYYLSKPKHDYDVAIMFYASWCTNCRALAPIWDAIASMIKAGTTDSNMIMGLFDCEANYEHSEVCSQIGITHYPTLQFISLSGQRFSRKEPKHLTKFGGNWQYGDALLDWVKTMSFMSQWHRAGWGKKLRSMIFGAGKKDKDESYNLPVGIPGSVAAMAQASEMQDAVTQLQELVGRSSVMVDALLFPVDAGNPSVMSDASGKTFTDLYKHMAEASIWESSDKNDSVVRTCTVELSLDYCQRVASKGMEAWLARKPIEEITEDDWKSFEDDLKSEVNKMEPFCGVIDECVQRGFDQQHCRPDSCPFLDTAACRFLTGCLTDSMQYEYAQALETIQETAEARLKETTSSPRGGGGWFANA